jgi:tRNA dimethylallyltransferase
MVAHIREGLDWQEAIRTMQRDTRHYAKRQLTWFQREPDTVWTDPGGVEALQPHISRFLNESPAQPAG